MTDLQQAQPRPGGAASDWTDDVTDTAIERSKRFVYRHFERLLVVVLVASLLLIHGFIEYKLAFLSFYYLPIISAGFLLGRRSAVWAAVFVFLLASFIQATRGLEGHVGLHLDDLLYLVPWGGFLILTGFAVGVLAEQRRARTDEVRTTYLTMLELLTLHVDSENRLRQGHSYRVGERAAELARELGLDDAQQERLRVAGLLHEVGPRDPRLVLAAAPAGGSESRLNPLAGALRLVDEYSRYHQIAASRRNIDEARVSIGARILAVADAFETLQTETATRPAFAPWTALEEVERGAGVNFATEVVKALRRAVNSGRADVGKNEQQPRIRLA